MKKKTQILFFIFCLFLTAYISFYIHNITKDNNTTSESLIINESESSKKEYHLTLGMVGDALYHNVVYNDGLQSNGKYNFDSQLVDITPIIATYDLAYYNQETILGGTSMGLSTYPRFNSPQEVGDAYVKAGFNLVSLANNHTMDRGEQAILNSVAYWKSKKDVMTSGSYASFDDRNKINIGSKNGITYAFLSYTYGTNGLPVPEGKEYLVNLIDEEKIKNDVEAVRNKVDIVIVAMHWGVEYTHTPSDEQRSQAQFLASLGVDIIIGSHPHVIQPIERIGKSVVIYSLGNFISAQDGLAKNIGMIASLDINKVIENDSTTITIDNIKGDLIYTYHNHYKNFRVIPFYKMNNTILNNYENIKTTYESIINKNDSTIKVGTLKEV